MYSFRGLSMNTLNTDISNSRKLSYRIYSDLFQNSPSFLSIFRKDLKLNVFKNGTCAYSLLLYLFCTVLCSKASYRGLFLFVITTGTSSILWLLQKYVKLDLCHWRRSFSMAIDICLDLWVAASAEPSFLKWNFCF